MKHREESWKYDALGSIFDELRGVSSGDETLHLMFDILHETLCRMLDITWFLEGEIEDAKMGSFSSEFQTLIKH